MEINSSSAWRDFHSTAESVITRRGQIDRHAGASTDGRDCDSCSLKEEKTDVRRDLIANVNQAMMTAATPTTTDPVTRDTRVIAADAHTRQWSAW